MSTPASISTAFAKGASAYKTYLDSPHGRLRLEIVWRQLSRLMTTSPATHAGSLQVLDIGCGTGDIALRLAARGHAVTLLDPVREMLHLAREKAQTLTPAPAISPRFLQGSLDAMPLALTRKTFDLLLCHTVVEYLPDPERAVVPMGSLLAPGGHLSLVALNRWQDPFRLAVRDGKLEEARKVLEGDAPADSLFGLPRRGITADDMRGHCAAAGIEVVGHEGVVVFADYLPAAVLEHPAHAADLLRLEVEAGGRTPFKDVARYLHLWARRAG